MAASSSNAAAERAFEGRQSAHGKRYTFVRETRLSSTAR